jgi:CubicO group peptidase (beta-lactamase class C family)
VKSTLQFGRRRGRRPLWIALASTLIWLLANDGSAAQSRPISEATPLETGLDMQPPGEPSRRVTLTQALRILKIPSVSMAIISEDRIEWTAAYSDGDASTRTAYQAGSMSKTVTAVVALRLVEQGRLALDRDVNAALTSWHVPRTSLTRRHPVTLRGLLSMTAGINVPGFVGYRPGATLPSLVQILDGSPPANSPPVRVLRTPGRGYTYSGGGYEIGQALLQDAARQPFPELVRELVLQPVGMNDSFFGQRPPTPGLQMATGHLSSGAELPGDWRAMPEMAAGGLWSTPTDLARLLIGISRSYKGKDDALLSQAMAREMLKRQDNGPYGLGAAVSGSGRSLVLMKRGQNVGYQGYMLIFPATGQGIVVMANSDNGTTLATSLIRKAASVYRWPRLGELHD